MTYNTLFSTYQLGDTTLTNRSVMAPMTRSRAIGNTPNALIAEYYGQRAGAGLIVTEGVAPSPNGLGYPRTPGVYSEQQIEDWKLTSEAVHKKGGHIFMQLMHVGRIAHAENVPDGGETVAPSAIQAKGQMFTDVGGMQDHPVPRAMTAEDVESTIQEFVTASENAVKAGMDGVELHGANGYLIEQFLNPGANQRTDEFGGTPENRNRFAIEVARRAAAAIGAKRVGIRLSPFGAFNDVFPFEGTHEQYVALAAELGKLGLAYIHLVDHSGQGAPEVPAATKAAIKEAFGGTLILSGGYEADRAEEDLAAGRADLVAFGRPFLANADLLERFKSGSDLNQPDYTKLYTPGPEGFTDYPLAS